MVAVCCSKQQHFLISALSSLSADALQQTGLHDSRPSTRPRASQLSAADEQSRVGLGDLHAAAEPVMVVLSVLPAAMMAAAAAAAAVTLTVPTAVTQLATVRLLMS